MNRGSRGLWDIITWTIVYIMEISEGEERKGAVSLFEEIMDKRVPNLRKEIDMQTQDTQQILIQ